ncbi:hypothetical protein THIOSC13_1910002 [uncultured Thiomicrorhabdus sp.]
MLTYKPLEPEEIESRAIEIAEEIVGEIEQIDMPVALRTYLIDCLTTLKRLKKRLLLITEMLMKIT